LLKAKGPLRSLHGYQQKLRNFAIRSIPVRTKLLLPGRVAVTGEFSLVKRIAAELVVDNDGVFTMERVILGAVELETVGSGPEPP
jgi:hypothetical protein